MKKNIQTTFLFICVLAFSARAHAQAILIHYWNFNNYTRTDYYPNITPIKANYSIIDTNKAQITYKAQPGFNPASYTGITYLGTYTATDTLNASVNLRNGDTIGNSMRAANPSDSMELVFYIPSTKYKNLRFKYISYPSSTTSGQLVQNYDYSVDSGTTWKTTGLSRLSDTFTAKIWRLENLTFGTDTTVNNNSKLVFRVRFAVNSATTTGGNNRFDNVTLDGDSITTVVDTSHSHVSVTNVNGSASFCKIFPNPANSTLNVVTADAGEKNIGIYNVVGQKVLSGVFDDKQSTIDVSMLKAGMYYIHVAMKEGSVYTTSFIKN